MTEPISTPLYLTGTPTLDPFTEPWSTAQTGMFFGTVLVLHYSNAAMMAACNVLKPFASSLNSRGMSHLADDAADELSDPRDGEKHLAVGSPAIRRRFDLESVEASCQAP